MTTINQTEIAAVQAIAAENNTPSYTLTATYSPEDNKLRLKPIVPGTRLDAATYARVSETGFKWAPMQKIFVAPMWTPARYDLAVELCGEVGDEDTSLIDRAEGRAERFEEYSERRADDAEAARNAVASISDQIPLGQPVLVGHHSERRARKDAQRIENAMRKAVDMWETSQYWTRRAAGAVRAAKYKERADVRYRRIKGLEADKRKQEKAVSEAQMFLKMWGKENLTVDQAAKIAGYNHIPYQEKGKPFTSSIYSMLTDGKITVEKAKEEADKENNRRLAWASRWLSHYDNRIAYERAMLDEQGGLAAEQVDIQVGGRVLIGNEWLVVIRVNKTGGKINSVTTNAKYVRIRGIEEVKDYKAPEAEEAEKVKKATTLPPLCNYPGEGFLSMTKAEYDKRHKDVKFIRPIKASEQHSKHRVRFAYLPNKNYATVQVFLTDAKRVDPPAAPTTPVAPVTFERQQEIMAEPRQVYEAPKQTEFDLMRETLKQGVQVVSAPQLFVTQPELAARMVAIAGIEPGHTVREPSAGTGNIIRAIAQTIDLDKITLSAIEINQNLTQGLRSSFPNIQIQCADFLELAPVPECDRILMNPPFANGQDIAHITHAIKMLKPKGRLVAICGNGPRQREKLMPLIEQHGGTWEDLPAGTFKESGTMVNTALIILDL
jgi:protein-L-isoaspartate O-methyltransferase